MAVATLLVLLVCYHLFVLWRAHQRTPAVMAAARTGEIQLANVPKRRVVMLLKIEDPNFLAHRGVDFSTPGAGMTTITQSLVKRFYFENFQPGFAKLEQSLIARFVLDPKLSKAAQLQAFLNHSHFGWRAGRPIVGFAAAGRFYFGQEFANLSDHQFLSLVAMLIAPRRLDPLLHRADNAERVRRIQAMLAGKCSAQGLRDVALKSC
jgi:membrane carboxypeptidase/penicillin-binding protein